MIDQLINQIIPDCQVLKDEPLKNHTTFKIGGNADYFITVKTEEELKNLLELIISNNIEYFVIANGSNILVSDNGYQGVIIHPLFTEIELHDNLLTVESGLDLRDVSEYALVHSLTGLEWAIGIPGTIGGAIRMNAGAYEGQMADVINTVTYMDLQGNTKELNNEQLDFGYRHSFFKENPGVILKAELKLVPGMYALIKDKMDDLTKRRTTKQPLEMASAGSTFKRNEKSIPTTKLIDQAGLKGYTVGGAQVSEKHPGFVINTGNATAMDVMNLIKHIQDVIKEKHDMDIETEVITLGF